MPLAVASHMFRRLKNSIYPSQPAEEIPETATLDSADSSTAVTESNLEPTSDNRPHDLSTFNFLSLVDSNASSSSLSEGASTFNLVQPHSSSASQDAVPPRRRLSSNPSVNFLDANAQTILRKRILEIQCLILPEREKALLVQVIPYRGLFVELFVRH